MILTENGVLKLMQRIKSFITSQLNTKANSVHTHVYSKSEVDTLLADYIPKSGGRVFDGLEYSRNVDNSVLNFNGGTRWDTGAQLQLFGKDIVAESPGAFILYATLPNARSRFQGNPNGTLTWNGQGIQTTSDQRLKQQISKIDNALLDAWQDVLPCQFKYNDAVNEKGDNARLHTGYVVQQIDTACKSHNLDISAYGLYCHEEYPERTEEVTITNEDGTTSKETKVIEEAVIEEASEHYSLRYTETLVVECAYLRRENARLKERLQQHDDYFSNIEKRLQSLENS